VWLSFSDHIQEWRRYCTNYFLKNEYLFEAVKGFGDKSTENDVF